MTINILHLPNSIGGNAVSLVEGERTLGLNSRALSVVNTHFDHPMDIYVDLTNKNLFQQFLARLRTFFKYRQGFDVYHFNFGASLIHAPRYGLNLLDLPYYDHKAIKIMTYQGCDARQKYPTIQRVNSYPDAVTAACSR